MGRKAKVVEDEGTYAGSDSARPASGEMPEEVKALNLKLINAVALPLLTATNLLHRVVQRTKLMPETVAEQFADVNVPRAIASACLALRCAGELGKIAEELKEIGEGILRPLGEADEGLKEVLSQLGDTETDADWCLASADVVARYKLADFGPFCLVMVNRYEAIAPLVRYIAELDS